VTCLLASQTLAEFGYARTSLRDIAQNSNFSHGVEPEPVRILVSLVTAEGRAAAQELLDHRRARW